jgi:DNA repair exonuclease SbcCD ATPase subunit
MDRTLATVEGEWLKARRQVRQLTDERDRLSARCCDLEKELDERDERKAPVDAEERIDKATEDWRQFELQRIDRRIQDIAQKLDRRILETDNRCSANEEELRTHDRRLDNMGDHMGDVDNRLEKLAGTVGEGGMIPRLYSQLFDRVTDLQQQIARVAKDTTQPVGPGYCPQCGEPRDTAGKCGCEDD